MDQVQRTARSSAMESFGAASHLSKLCSSRRSARKSTQRVPARLRPYNLFSQSSKDRGRIPQRGLLFQPLSWWVHVTSFVLVHVEVRVGHVCCECVIRLLETQEVDDESRARGRARCEHIVHCFVTLELSRDESCSDSVFSCSPDPSVSSLVFCRELCAYPLSRTLRILRVGRFLSAWPSSPPQSP